VSNISLEVSSQTCLVEPLVAEEEFVFSLPPPAIDTMIAKAMGKKTKTESKIHTIFLALLIYKPLDSALSVKFI
jgi:hypothetical protein